jgi:hypothetical protein
MSRGVFVCCALRYVYYVDQVGRRTNENSFGSECLLYLSVTGKRKIWIMKTKLKKHYPYYSLCATSLTIGVDQTFKGLSETFIIRSSLSWMFSRTL